MSKGVVLLCAGGTGGHLFPAEAVAHELVSRGYTVHLAADDRVERFAGNFPAERIHQIKSATVSSRNPIVLLKAVFTLFSGYMESRKLIKRIKPKAVAGFGGYPTVPPLLAASHLGFPTLVHEANAVLGRANKMLASRVRKVAIGFGNTDKAEAMNVTVTGNPVRPAILEAAKDEYADRAHSEPFNLLVFGGSQGAQFFGEVVTKACELLSDEHKSLLRIVQQTRADDKDSVTQSYKTLGIEAHVDTFFTDMAEKLSDAHLVVSRAGASTVSELSVIGRPAMLVPYPHALDHDQASNAATVNEAGGVEIFQQSSLTPELLAKQLTAAISDPKRLALMAKNAKNTGRPNAATELADILEEMIAGN
ncbi:MAG: undecaprenyldiphospho-muramoylpentapeptide beta-N-acetylglucosaminyltransferase [Pseudomonadota bacterium]